MKVFGDNESNRQDIHMTKVAITEPLLHALVWPPYCSAKVKQTTELSSKLKPGRSSCSRISFHEAFGSLICFGTWKKSNAMPIIGPPTGKLIQKHHRQVTFVVKAPPIRGPITVENIKMAIQRPISMGRCWGGATKLIMRTEPAKVPAIPKP